MGTTGITASIGGTNRTNLVFKAGSNFAVRADGTLYAAGIISDKGAYSSLQFVGNGTSENGFDIKCAGSGFYWLGGQYDEVSPYKYVIKIDVDIPSNFTIDKATLTIRHIPLYNGGSIYGSARNIRCKRLNLANGQNICI